jgi:MFS family permease
VHAVDAGFFGLALGFASFVTVVPLFLSNFTSSPVILALVVVLHPLGWHIPQLMAVGGVAGRDRLLPTVLRRTVGERVPFFLLAVLAAASAGLSPEVVIVLTYTLALGTGLGGGITAPPFLTMASRILPPWRQGIFLGMKTSTANIGVALGSVGAGVILAGTAGSAGFAIVFAAAGVAAVVSWAFLAMTRERPAPVHIPSARARLMGEATQVLRTDSNFRWYVAARWLSQFAMMGLTMFAVYAVDGLNMSKAGIGIATGLFALAQVVANPVLGAVCDRSGFRPVMAAGMLAASVASVIAAMATRPEWFGVVFLVAGLANVAAWTVPLAFTARFAPPGQAPLYIGLGNSAVAPSILIAPLVGGLIAQRASYPAAFAVAAAAGVLAALVIASKVVEPGEGARRV